MKVTHLNHFGTESLDLDFLYFMNILQKEESFTGFRFYIFQIAEDD